jgi:hypothetical protein
MTQRTKIEAAIDRTLAEVTPNYSVAQRTVLRECVLDAIETAGFEITRKARSVGNEDGGVSPAVHQAAMREHGGATDGVKLTTGLYERGDGSVGPFPGERTALDDLDADVQSFMDRDRE